jgi:predicted nucleotidyltransferase
MLAIETIRQCLLPLADKYNIKKVDLFGSYASGTATEHSDADFLIEFSCEMPSIFAIMGFREELGRALKNPVDVVVLPMPHPELLDIESVVNVYDRP